MHNYKAKQHESFIQAMINIDQSERQIEYEYMTQLPVKEEKE